MSTLREVGIQLRGYVYHRFDRLLPSYQKYRQRSKDYEGILAKQEGRKARIHDLQEEVVGLKKSLSEAASDDLEKTCRDHVMVRESLEKEYRHEIKSLN